jgi:hypothetical protein
MEDRLRKHVRETVKRTGPACSAVSVATAAGEKVRELWGFREAIDFGSTVRTLVFTLNGK